MGDISYFIGMEIHRTPTTISLSHAHYDLDLLKKFHMWSCKPSPTPLTSSNRLSILNGDPLQDAATYRSMVGWSLQICCGVSFCLPSLCILNNSCDVQRTMVFLIGVSSRISDPWHAKQL
ncbi:unnamed protein product [Prunus brigantina]